MKKFIYIFLFISGFAFSQATPESFGAVGNGIADDTSEIQAWLNSGGNLQATNGATYLISSTIQVTQSFAHTSVNWNNSTITTNTTDLLFFNIDKRASNGGLTVMSNLLIDANDTGMQGLWVYSRSELTNVDGIDYAQSANANSSPFHINATFQSNDSDAHGDWVFDGCDVDGLLGFGNYCDYCDGIGAANGYLVNWKVVPNTATNITFKNSSSLNGYGVDGQNVGIFSPGIDMTNSLGYAIFDNVTTKGFDRRGWKALAGNLIIKNCLIQDNPESDGLTTCGTTGTGAGCAQLGATGTPNQSAGLFTMGAGSGATGAGNIVIENTTFVQVPNGTDGRVIASNMTGTLDINNSTFSGGADFAITNKQDVINICSTTFGSGSIIYEYNTRTPYATLNLDTDNVYTSFTPSLANTTINNVDLTCVPDTGSGAVTAIDFNNDTQTINSGESVDLGVTFTPFNPTNTGVTYVSSNTGVVSNAGAWVGAGTATITVTSNDTTNGTITDVMNVTANGADTEPPVFESLQVFDIGTNRFWVTWTISEPSKGQIFYGTTSDLTEPYTYDFSTTLENTTTFLTHIQPVGSNNAPPLDPFTLYYFRIYMEDAAGNIAYSDEFFTSTLGILKKAEFNLNSSLFFGGNRVKIFTRAN